MPLENIGPKPASRTLVNRPNDNKAAKKPKAKATESLAPPLDKLHDHDSCEENTRGLFGQKCKRTQKPTMQALFKSSLQRVSTMAARMRNINKESGLAIS